MYRGIVTIYILISILIMLDIGFEKISRNKAPPPFAIMSDNLKT